MPPLPDTSTNAGTLCIVYHHVVEYEVILITTHIYLLCYFLFLALSLLHVSLTVWEREI